MSQPRLVSNGTINKLFVEDSAAHDWYRFVLSFPPHLIRKYVQDFGLDSGSYVLDPFSGTGTTVVECKKLGVQSVGIEAHPFSHFASTVKVDWSPDPKGLEKHAGIIAQHALATLKAVGIEDDATLPLFTDTNSPNLSLRSLDPERLKLLLTNSISPLPLYKVLVLLESIEVHRDERYYSHERLALAKALVYSIGNLHFGPEVGVGKPKADAKVVSGWLHGVQSMADDLRELQHFPPAQAVVHHSDSRQTLQILKPNSIDAVITSPPYPNEKDYTRTTRLESVLLGFVNSKAELQALKRGLMRSNTRTVYKGDEDDLWVAEHGEIQRIAAEIEAKRIELGKTSGFEKLYAKVTKLYFGGMTRHLADLRQALRPGAYLAYVVGDQASYFRVMIRTGQLLADIAQSLGYKVVDIELFRSRLSTVTKEQLREETVILQWTGKALSKNKTYSKIHD